MHFMGNDVEDAEFSESVDVTPPPPVAEPDKKEDKKESKKK